MNTEPTSLSAIDLPVADTDVPEAPTTETFGPQEDAEWRWAIDTTNPFEADLVLTEEDDEVLRWQLTPVVVRELHAALTVLKAEQLNALTGQDPAIITSEPSAEDGARAVSEEPVPTRSWWVRHKVLTAFLGLVVALFLTGLVLGGSQV